MLLDTFAKTKTPLNYVGSTSQISLRYLSVYIHVKMDMYIIVCFFGILQASVNVQHVSGNNICQHIIMKNIVPLTHV